MTASTVYFTNLRGKMGYNLLDKTRKLFGHSGFADSISPGDKVAVKLHFGEEGNTAFLPPMYARVVVEEIKKAG
ncbi:4Fe-4S ferredoxin, partial [bacterium]|nr:4Fe-4S ferredoxin [bacterium]